MPYTRTGLKHAVAIFSVMLFSCYRTGTKIAIVELPKQQHSMHSELGKSSEFDFSGSLQQQDNNS